MKTVNSIKLNSTFGKAAFAFLFVSLFTASNLQATDTTKAPPVEFKYIGSMDYKPVFQINYDNPNAEEVYLTLKDENGFVIYSDIIKDRKYSKKIQLENVDLDALKLTVTLRTKKDFETQDFQVNKNTRTVEDVVISRL